MACQRASPANRAVALHHVQHACRNSCLQRQLAQPVGSQRHSSDITRAPRCCLAGHGISSRGRQAFTATPARERRPGCTAYSEHLSSAAGWNACVHLLGTSGEEFEVMRARGISVFSLVNRQAGVGGFHRRDFRYVLVNQVTQTTSGARALHRLELAPFRERMARHDNWFTSASPPEATSHQRHRSPG